MKTNDIEKVVNEIRPVVAEYYEFMKQSTENEALAGNLALALQTFLVAQAFRDNDD